MEEMNLYIVETVSIFRMRYAVRAKEPGHAEDCVVCHEMEDEMSQKHLDEIITSVRKVSEKKYLKIFNEDNDYIKSWSDERKLNMIYNCPYGDQK